mgnify:FL=1
MASNIIQRIVFITCVIFAFLNPMFEDTGFIKIILLIGSIYYLFLGWKLPLIWDRKEYLEHEIAGFVYSTVLFANFFDSLAMPTAKYLLYFSYIISLVFMIFMIIKRKNVKKDMLIQAIILWLFAPIPLWI